MRNRNAELLWSDDWIDKKSVTCLVVRRDDNRRDGDTLDIVDQFLLSPPSAELECVHRDTAHLSCPLVLLCTSVRCSCFWWLHWMSLSQKNVIDAWLLHKKNLSFFWRNLIKVSLQHHPLIITYKTWLFINSYIYTVQHYAYPTYTGTHWIFHTTFFSACCGGCRHFILLSFISHHSPTTTTESIYNLPGSCSACLCIVWPCFCY